MYGDSEEANLGTSGREPWPDWEILQEALEKLRKALGEDLGKNPGKNRNLF